MRGNETGHSHWVLASAVYVPSLTAKGESRLSEMSNSGNLLRLYRTGLRVPARSTQPGPVSSSASCRPPGLLLMLHPSVRHYAANRVDGSTGSGAEREVKSTGLDNLHHSRANSQGIRASNQPIGSARRVRRDRTRRPQVCIAEGSRELQAGCRWKTEATRKKENPHAKLRFRSQRLIFQIRRGDGTLCELCIVLLVTHLLWARRLERRERK